MHHSGRSSPRARPPEPPRRRPLVTAFARIVCDALPFLPPSLPRSVPSRWRRRSPRAATYLDARAEGALREALMRFVGPAASYDVSVTGRERRRDPLRAGPFRRHAGSLRERAPVLDRLELELRGVVIDRQEKRLTALAGATAALRIRAGDLADYLRERGWFDEARVVLAPPDRITISGMPRIGGTVIAGARRRRAAGPARRPGGAADAGGRCAFASADCEAPPLVRALLERAVNPLLDAGAVSGGGAARRGRGRRRLGRHRRLGQRPRRPGRPAIASTATTIICTRSRPL